MSVERFGERVSFIWSVADLLRGPYKPPQYGEVMLPFTVLRRLDCVLAETKSTVLARLDQADRIPGSAREAFLNRVAGQRFHNRSPFDLEKIRGAPNEVATNLLEYIKSFSMRARELLEHFGIEEQILTLDRHDRLYRVVSKFCEIDLHPRTVPNEEMGYIFEELIRRFSEQANEQAGDHFTPREVIRLMVNLLFNPDSDVLTTPGIVRTLLDPAAGTGGMLSIGDEYVRELNRQARLILFGQEVNPSSYAVCGSDMLIKGEEIENIKLGDSFTDDGHAGERFDYMLANPPFGVDWKVQQDTLVREHRERGYAGRFGAGLPRINDGSFLFLQHMISKMKPVDEGGSRIGIVFNGSPLFSGDAGSGESNIRRWIIENDWLETIVARPDQLFYNTGISTYIWLVTNRKEPKRRGKIQFIDATSMFRRMRRSLGNKRNEIAPKQIDEITNLYGDFVEGERVRIFDNTAFGYRKITIERPLRLRFNVTSERISRLWEQKAFRELGAAPSRRGRREQQAEPMRQLFDEASSIELSGDGRPVDATAEQEAVLAVVRLLPPGPYIDRADFEKALDLAAGRRGLRLAASVRKAILAALGERDEAAAICRDAKGQPEPDPELRDTESVPLTEDVDAYFVREVAPHLPDAWINRTVVDELDGGVGKVGCEINFNRYFYRHVSPRPLETIEAEMKVLEREILELLREVAG